MKGFMRVFAAIMALVWFGVSCYFTYTSAGMGLMVTGLYALGTIMLYVVCKLVIKFCY